MYSGAELAVIQGLISHFTELSATRVSTSIDSVFNSIQSENARHGLIVEFNGGRREAREPFKKRVWVWSIACVLVIQFMATQDMELIEADLRGMIDKVSTLFSADHTLGMNGARIEVVDIGRAEPGTVNETPYYWLPFIIEVVTMPM